MISTTRPDKPSFQVVSEVSEDLASTAKQVADYVMSYIQLDSGDIQSFDWASFKKDIDSYKGDELTFDNFSNHDINEGDLKVSDIIQKIVALCQAAGASTKGVDLTALITKLLIDLKQAEESGYADFSKSDDDSNASGWECRIIFMIPYDTATRYFKGVLATFKLKAKLEGKDAWFKLDDSAVLKGFTGVVDLMGLVVGRGFENPMFDAIFINPSNDILVPSQQVAVLLNKYIDSQNGLFNWAGFKKAIDEYSGDDLAYDKFASGDIDQNKQSLKEVIEKIVAITGEGKELTETILGIFTSLQNRSRAGYLQFSRVDDGKSAWEYRVVLFTPMANLPTYFNGTAITIQITANLGNESSWWGLKESTSETFSAKVQALKLVIGTSYQCDSVGI